MKNKTILWMLLIFIIPTAYAAWLDTPPPLLSITGSTLDSNTTYIFTLSNNSQIGLLSCPNDYILKYNVTYGGFQCQELNITGTGTVTNVQTDNKYLTGGPITTTGTIVFNESILNATIDARSSSASNTQWDISTSKYLGNFSTILDVNETVLNATIKALDSNETAAMNNIRAFSCGGTNKVSSFTADALPQCTADEDTTYTEDSKYLTLVGTVFGFSESTLNTTIDSRFSINPYIIGIQTNVSILQSNVLGLQNSLSNTNNTVNTNTDNILSLSNSLTNTNVTVNQNVLNIIGLQTSLFNTNNTVNNNSAQLLIHNQSIINNYDWLTSLSGSLFNTNTTVNTNYDNILGLQSSLSNTNVTVNNNAAQLLIHNASLVDINIEITSIDNQLTIHNNSITNLNSRAVIANASIIDNKLDIAFNNGKFSDYWNTSTVLSVPLVTSSYIEYTGGNETGTTHKINITQHYPNGCKSGWNSTGLYFIC